MAVRFVEETHQYFTPEGVELPSNTFLLKWAGLSDSTWYTPESAARGTRVHRALHLLCEGDLDWKTVLPEEVGYVKAVEKFLASTSFVVEANEFPIWSAHGYATTPDILGILNGRRVIVQVKSGDLRPEIRIQTALEKIAVNERIHARDEAWAERLEYVNHSPYADGRFGLRLFPDGRYKLAPEFTDPADEEVALGIVKKWNWMKAHGYKVAA